MRLPFAVFTSLSFLALIGCQSQPKAPAHQEFKQASGYASEGKSKTLKGSGLKKLIEVLDLYGNAKSFSATNTWKFVANGKVKDVASSDRLILYMAPNFHRVVAKTGSMTFSSISDGRVVLENSEKNYEQSWATPYFSVATAPIVSDPQLAGSILYKFFGGKDSIQTIVDPVADVEELPGPTAATKTLRFYAKGDFGTTSVTINSANMVTKIQTSNEPMIKKTSELQEDAKLKSLEVTEEFADIKFNTEIKTEAFSTKPPIGVKVRDSRAAKTETAEVGGLAPDFSLAGKSGTFKLSDLRGEVILLGFWSPNQGIGSRQMLSVLGKAVDDFEPKGARILSVTNVEGEVSKLFLEETRTTDKFPVMFDKEGTVIKAFGLRKKEDQVDSLPALFVINKKGLVTKIFFQVPTRTEVAEALAEAGL